MSTSSRMTRRAVVGGLVLLCLPAVSLAQGGQLIPVTHVASIAAGFDPGDGAGRARRAGVGCDDLGARRVDGVRAQRSQRPVRNPDAVARAVPAARASHRLRRLARSGDRRPPERARVFFDRVAPRVGGQRRGFLPGPRRRRRTAAGNAGPRGRARGGGADRQRRSRRAGVAPASRAADDPQGRDGSRRVRRRRPVGRGVRRPQRVRPHFDLVGARRVELLRGDAVLRPGQPVDHRIVRYAAAAVLPGQLRAQHRVSRARRAGRRARRLDGARRADAGRHRVVDRRRRVHHARAGAAPLRHRHVVQHAALRRRQRRRRCATSPTAAATPARSTRSIPSRCRRC